MLIFFFSYRKHTTTTNAKESKRIQKEVNGNQKHECVRKKWKKQTFVISLNGSELSLYENNETKGHMVLKSYKLLNLIDLLVRR